MGMYDDVEFEMNCPKCGSKVDGFQSKDGLCMLATLDFWEVNNFYSHCSKCKAWIEFNRKKPAQPSPIEDYEMTVEARG